MEMYESTVLTCQASELFVTLLTLYSIGMSLVSIRGPGVLVFD